ncbi:MAG: type II toxin-antitoxin system Phd/YefM family antitoxin [Firmicutes bacterium]|nr:type II toxin-antitoxin system Phd/YefM family antitoxin [Bacillota bacterium]
MGIRIKSLKEVRGRLLELVDTLHKGPVFLAKKGRVTAVLMDLADYHSLLGEIEDLHEIIHTMGDCECGCDDEALNKLMALNCEEGS